MGVTDLRARPQEEHAISERRRSSVSFAPDLERNKQQSQEEPKSPKSRRLLRKQSSEFLTVRQCEVLESALNREPAPSQRRMTCRKSRAPVESLINRRCGSPECLRPSVASTPDVIGQKPQR